MDRRFLVGLSIAAVILLALTGIGAWGLWTWRHPDVVRIMLAEAALYAAVAWFACRFDRRVDRRTRRAALLLILGTAGVMRLCLVLPPTVSTDIYRYIWDGRVQAAGINPYRYLPADPALAPLRDRAIYPFINRAATAPTIYPPMAQGIFLAVSRVSETVTAMKAAMVGFEIAIIWAIIVLLRRRGLPETRVLLYAWHPLPLFEFAGSGHIDAAAIAFMLLACLAADRRLPVLAGLLLAGGAAVKYFPAVIAPALYRRWDWRFPAAALVAIVLLYAPYLGIGWRVFGYLPGYAREEGLAAGNGFFLLGLIGKFLPLPPSATPAYLLLGLAILAAVALIVTFRKPAQAVAMGSALLLVTVFTIFLSPHLDWYFAWLVPFLCFSPSPALIYLTGAAPLLYGMIWNPDKVLLNAALYGPFAILLLLETLAGARRPIVEATDDGTSIRHPNKA